MILRFLYIFIYLRLLNDVDNTFYNLLYNETNSLSRCEIFNF